MVLGLNSVPDPEVTFSLLHAPEVTFSLLHVPLRWSDIQRRADTTQSFHFDQKWLLLTARAQPGVYAAQESISSC